MVSLQKCVISRGIWTNTTVCQNPSENANRYGLTCKSDTDDQSHLTYRTRRKDQSGNEASYLVI